MPVLYALQPTLPAKKFQAVLWDVDNTLIMSGNVHDQAVLMALGEFSPPKFNPSAPHELDILARAWMTRGSLAMAIRPNLMTLRGALPTFISKTSVTSSQGKGRSKPCVCWLD